MEEADICRIHKILHLIFHRNKNQHRRTKWWKWLSILKRTVWNLALSLGSAQERLPSAEFYRQYLADRVVPRCYEAFSVVVADVQFSALGTVLLATLACLSKWTGIDENLKSCSQVETACSDDLLDTTQIPSGQEDVGEALSRNGEVSGDFPQLRPQEISQPVFWNPGSITPSTPDAVKGPEVLRPKKEKRKKKKIHKNAIDDLFDGLL
ncbi:uncharacterized protein BJX67DRAFT_385080 [Aspergillus lucknowensis]|uniref:RNase MRP protein 1 RNA binding domain-containing protein n=1 Tax=Aspergillus lucknowensis TaxID=176173 RepID=A0ABR4LEK4_9EURO